MRLALAGLLLLAGCIDFDAIEREACQTRGLCQQDLLDWCQPCEADSHCRGWHARCLHPASGAFCALPCTKGVCAPGQECVFVPVPEGTAMLCIPSGGRQCDGGVP